MSNVDHKQTDFGQGTKKLTRASARQKEKLSTRHRNGSDLEEQLPKKRGHSSESDQDSSSNSSQQEEEPLRPQKITLKPNFAELQSAQSVLLAKLKSLRSTCGNLLNSIEEPPRTRCTQDYLLGEMEWMAQDFLKEKKLKTTNAKKMVKASQSVVEQTKEKNVLEEKSIEEGKQRLARKVSKMITTYWRKIAKLCLLYTSPSPRDS